jgi:peptidoglycan/LPS O-acetylase OafA/YrhL
MEYRREIDGLRALAVVPVILFHGGFNLFSGGFVGVDIFFVISGYLITSIIIDELQNEKFSLIKFYERRARRILPVLFFVLLVCLPFSWFLLLPSDLYNFAKSLVAISVFSSNFLFWRWSGYFDTASELKPLLHTWSLSVEEQFYLFFPLFFIYIWNNSRLKIFSIVGLLALISFIFSQYFSQERPFFAFYLLPTRAWELLVGSLLALYCNNNKRQIFGKGTHEILSLIGLAGVIFSILFFSRLTPTPSFFTLIPTLSSALLIFSANPSNFVGKILSSRPMVLIGLISYSAYLWHQPLFSFLKYSVDGRNEKLYVLTVILTLILAFLSWKYIENIFRNNEKFSRQFIFKYSLIISILYVLIGITGILNNGFSNRFSPEDKQLAEIDMFEEGKFVHRNFLLLQDKGFVENDKKKILLIGDSFAQDLTNAIFQSNIHKKIQISTHYISRNCGNLFQSFDLNNFIPKNQLSGCIKNGWYSHDLIQRQLLEADEIWLASDWPYWVAQKLNESIYNLEKKYQKKILIFGTKDFGQVPHPKELLKLSFEDRIRLTQFPSAEKELVSSYMKKTIPIKNYVDLMGLFCIENYPCGLFDKSGEILSVDGSHLTKAGATFLGKKLELFLIE